MKPEFIIGYTRDVPLDVFVKTAMELQKEGVWSLLSKDRYDIGQEISKLLCTSMEPLEDVKYLLLILKQYGYRILDTETIHHEMQVGEIEIKINGGF